MANELLNVMEEVAEEVYRSDPDELVEPMSFDEFDTDFSKTEWVTITVRGKKRKIEVVVTDQFQKLALSEVRRTENESLREYEENLLGLAFEDEKEALKTERDLSSRMSDSDKQEKLELEVKHQDYILTNFIKSPDITENTLDKVPQDVKDKMVEAYHKVNTPKAVLDKVSTFRGMGGKTREQVVSNNGVSKSEESGT